MNQRQTERIELHVAQNQIEFNKVKMNLLANEKKAAHTRKSKRKRNQKENSTSTSLHSFY